VIVEDEFDETVITLFAVALAPFSVAVHV